MNTSVAGLCAVFASFLSLAPSEVGEDPALKGAVRECQRAYYQFGRDLIGVAEAEVNDPTRFFAMLRERAADQKSLCRLLLAIAKERGTKDSLQAAMRELERIERELKDIGRRENYGELSLGLGRSILESTPFLEFLKASGAVRPPAVSDGVTQGH